MESYRKETELQKRKNILRKPAEKTCTDASQKRKMTDSEQKIIQKQKRTNEIKKFEAKNNKATNTGRTDKNIQMFSKSGRIFPNEKRPSRNKYDFTNSPPQVIHHQQADSKMQKPKMIGLDRTEFEKTIEVGTFTESFRESSDHENTQKNFEKSIRTKSAFDQIDPPQKNIKSDSIQPKAEETRSKIISDDSSRISDHNLDRHFDQSRDRAAESANRVRLPNRAGPKRNLHFPREEAETADSLSQFQKQRSIFDNNLEKQEQQSRRSTEKSRSNQEPKRRNSQIILSKTPKTGPQDRSPKKPKTLQPTLPTNSKSRANWRKKTESEHAAQAALEKYFSQIRNDSRTEISKKVLGVSKYIKKNSKHRSLRYFCRHFEKIKRKPRSYSRITKLQLIYDFVRLKKSFLLRNVQLLVLVLATHCAHQSAVKRLLQINTGEGKTLIIQCVALFHVLCARPVDIVTSTGVLARDNCADFAELLRGTCVSVDRICAKAQSHGPKHKRQKCYSADVVYGTCHQFCVDILAEYDDFEPVRV